MRGHRAFSLVEALIAVTVLGLGLLGLIAILAGAASQQQTASLQNLSVGVVRNAEGALEQQLGRPGGNFDAVREGQWLPVAMDDQTHYLTVAPGYLLASFPDSVDVLAERYQAGDFLPSPPSGLGLGGYNGSGSYAGNPIRRLRHRRVDIQAGLTITVTTLQYDSSTQRVDNERTMTFSPTTNAISNDADPASMDSPDSFGSVIVFDRREQSVSGAAGIASFNITLGGNEIINKITVGPYFWRNDQLMSLTDRIVAEPQADFPGGKRPIMTYSALIRRTDASTQICFFTYSCRPLSRPQDVVTSQFSGLAFVPPDTTDDVLNDLGVLREVQVDLGYEIETQRYFFEINATDEDEFEKGWALQPGQILMMSSRYGVTANEPDDFGADFPVEVVNVRTNSTSRKIQAFLDRSPRVRGRTPLEELTENFREPVHVWAVQPVVRSRTDGTEWALTPIEARVIQVADQ